MPQVMEGRYRKYYSILLFPCNCRGYVYSYAMPQNTRTATQLCTNKLRLGVSLSVPILVFGLANISQAATVPFTFELNYDAFVVGVPSPTTPTLLTMLSGSGLYAPFGRATYSEAGTITFAMLPFWRVCTVVRI